MHFAPSQHIIQDLLQMASPRPDNPLGDLELILRLQVDLITTHTLPFLHRDINTSPSLLTLDAGTNSCISVKSC